MRVMQPRGGAVPPLYRRPTAARSHVPTPFLQRQQLVGVLCRQVLPIHPLELRRIKYGRLFENPVERKEASQLLFAYDLAIAARTPSKQREKVAHRLWENT